MATCGLDFGTSNSAVALPDGRVMAIDHGAEPRLFRSVLFFPEGTRDHFGGQSAIDEYLSGSEGRFIQSIKSWLPSQSFHATQIRNRSYRLEELVALLLRTLRERAEKAHGQSFDGVTLGRPAVFSEEADADALAETRLRAAAELAGFRDIRFVLEPIAAALAYESSLSRDELVLVADFGAGTSDMTLMRLGPSHRGQPDRRNDVIASSGVRIGGDRFDAEIMRNKLLPYFGAGSSYEIMDKRMPFPAHILGKLLSWHEMSFIRERSTQDLLDRMLFSGDSVPAIEALQDLVLENLGFHLFRAIERAKIDLSNKSETTIVFNEARIAIREKITRIEFERFTAALRQSISDCAENLLSRADVAPARVDAVFLTGGSSQIPSIHQIFADRFGRDRLRTQDAFISVAEGLGRSIGAI